MTKLLLSLHVLAAIVAIGPVTVAASMFPALTRRTFAPAELSRTGGPGMPGEGEPDVRALAVLKNLHRICRVYAGLGILVPIFGLATASSLGVLTDAWLIASMILTAIAAVILVFAILPGQAAVLAGPAGSSGPGGPAGPSESGGPAGPAGVVAAEGATLAGRAAAASRLGMVTGVFNLLWATVVVLMIVRPGSTTGV